MQTMQIHYAGEKCVLLCNMLMLEEWNNVLKEIYYASSELLERYQVQKHEVDASAGEKA